MTVATTCSSTSAPSSAPDLGRCVKARRSPTRSSPIAALASLRPTICAPPAKQDFASSFALRGILPEIKLKAAQVARPFVLQALGTQSFVQAAVLYMTQLD